MDEIKELTGNDPGPTSLILVGVHGDENVGVRAVENILTGALKINSGRVIFCVGNPKALAQNTRYIEFNLNRMFREPISENEKGSYEYDRAQFLKRYLDQSTALLDIHASHTPSSKPFIICEANAKGIAEYLPADLQVSGFDKVEPGGTDYYMNKKGGVGICMECGYFLGEDALGIAEKSILAFLKARGHTYNDLRSNKQKRMSAYQLYTTKSEHFTLSRPFADFEILNTGDLIGIDGDQEVRAIKKSVILFARARNKKGAEGFILLE